MMHSVNNIAASQRALKMMPHLKNSLVEKGYELGFKVVYGGGAKPKLYYIASGRSISPRNWDGTTPVIHNGKKVFAPASKTVIRGADPTKTVLSFARATKSEIAAAADRYQKETDEIRRKQKASFFFLPIGKGFYLKKTYAIGGLVVLMILGGLMYARPF